jgi:hypothetical protein
MESGTGYTSFGAGVQPHRAGDNNGSFVYPALHGGARCSGADAADAPPMGTRFQLAMSDAQIDALAVPSWKKTILRAMAHYGMFVGDTGGGAGPGLMMESGTGYTSFGAEDPSVTFAKQQGLQPGWHSLYTFDIASGVDWQSALRVVAPPAQQ